MITYEAFFVGVGGVVLGALIGSLLTYLFQKELLKQQLVFQQKLLDQQLVANEKSHQEHLDFILKATNSDYAGLTGIMQATSKGLTEVSSAIKESRRAG